jgi:hypothetical protein
MLRSFDGCLYPNGLHDYMAALSAFLLDTQLLTPVMNAAGLSAAGWFRHMLTQHRHSRGLWTRVSFDPLPLQPNGFHNIV